MQYWALKILGSWPWISGVTWRNHSRDHWNRNVWFPIGSQFEPTVCLARLFRYQIYADTLPLVAYFKLHSLPVPRIYELRTHVSANIKQSPSSDKKIENNNLCTDLGVSRFKPVTRMSVHAQYRCYLQSLHCVQFHSAISFELLTLIVFFKISSVFVFFFVSVTCGRD